MQLKLAIKLFKKFDAKPVKLEMKKKQDRFLYRASAATVTIIRRTIRSPKTSKTPKVVRKPSLKTFKNLNNYRSKQVNKRSQTGTAPISGKKKILKTHLGFWPKLKEGFSLVGSSLLPGSGSAPGVLEHGGHAKSGWNKGKYQGPRPYLGPALEKAQKGFQKYWG